MLQNPSMIFFLVSSLFVFSASEPPAVAVTFVTLTFILFPRIWPINIQPPCTSSLWVICQIYFADYYSLSPLSISASSDRKYWRMYLALGLISRELFLPSFYLNTNSSVVRNSIFQVYKYCFFILIHDLLVFFPSLPFLTSLHKSHVFPRLFKLRIKSTPPIRNFLESFDTFFAL